MKLAVEFSHLMLLLDLNTGARKYFLVPEGEVTPVHAPGLTIGTLRKLMRPELMGDIEGELAVQAPASAEPQPPMSVLPPEQPPVMPATMVTVATAAAVLAPGTLGDAPTDPFGAGEG